jgi:hypothetical protein
LLLKEHSEKHSKNRSLNVKFKYIDPSYMIRGLRANPQDAIAARKQVDPKGDFWHSVIESTGQSTKFFSKS